MRFPWLTRDQMERNLMSAPTRDARIPMLRMGPLHAARAAMGFPWLTRDQMERNLMSAPTRDARISKLRMGPFHAARAAMSARLSLAAPVLLLAACATPDRIVLLPDDQGKVGQLNVGGGDGDLLLDSAYASASASGKAKPQRGATSPEQVRQEFGVVLDALPQAPVSYMLFFVSDSDTLIPESRNLAPVILAEIAKRPAAEVVVIGHTDTQGSDEYNDKLSLDRARAVKQQLIALGFDPTHISVEGRGKRELMVRTGDNVAETHNRRAEILVR
jgi:outer membrane protein OmpA-like peptidoglycan-associated protein